MYLTGEKRGWGIGFKIQELSILRISAPSTKNVGTRKYQKEWGDKSTEYYEFQIRMRKNINYWISSFITF